MVTPDRADERYKYFHGKSGFAARFIKKKKQPLLNLQVMDYEPEYFIFLESNTTIKCNPL